MRKASVAVVGVLWLLVSQAGAAMASGSGPQTWTVVSRNGQPTRVAASGVVRSAGTVTDFLVLHLDTGTFDNHAVQTFPEGTLLYHGQGTAQLVVDPRTCIGTGRFVGPFVIEGGTGAYARATGSGTAIGDLTFVFRPTATGCSQTPIQSWGVAHATGQLTVP
jgi:hypothetical protein